MIEQVDVNVNADKVVREFRHFYRAFGYANVDYTYTQPSRKMYEYLTSYNNHCLYMRMHNILTSHGRGDYYLVNEGLDYGGIDGSIVHIDQDGNIQFEWDKVDRVYDILVKYGIKPIVETVYIPLPLRKSKELHYLPKDFKVWHKLIREFVLHVQQRYGREEIETWYFEIWNEPDNHKIWLENLESFFALYDYMEDAVHSVNDRIKVGGPATKQSEASFVLFQKFLEHCTHGVNYATGRYGSRIDFVSVHCKGGRPELYSPSIEYMFGALKRYIEILKQYPELKGIEFLNDESDESWKGNMGIQEESWFNFRNTHYFPGFVCKMVNTYCDVVEDQYEINLTVADSDNCHLQWEKFLFSGNRSQLTPLVRYGSTDLLKKPIFNAYVLLSHLGDKRLNVSSGNDCFGRKFGALPTMRNDILSIMVWNFEDGITDEVNDRLIKLKITGIPFRGKYRQIHYRIDKDHSNSYNTWVALGKPGHPTVEQIKQLRRREGLELYEPIKEIEMKSEIEFELAMPMHSISLIKLVPYNQHAPAVPTNIKAIVERGFNGNKQVFLKWKPNEETDFVYYKIWRRKEGEQEYKLLNDYFLTTSIYIDMDVENSTYYYKIQSVNASGQESLLSDDIIVTT
ncbi:GH39 family glycosyl hydrolase [Caldanaerobius polysaccharolyticus]|uniref:GH39 family glycosyl hydrolase n=1 Tax=Caldanaerobius polysaccharolyticus TaxID=44256 RepID=UPI00047A8A1E|nr:hypothetical protein [Caldanaerobius polysaccharolyticus]